MTDGEFDEQDDDAPSVEGESIPDSVGNGESADMNEPDPYDRSTWEGDRPPEDAIASANDFKVKRDAEGNVQPVWERVPGSNPPEYMKVIPGSQGDAEKYLPESGQPSDMSNRQVVLVLDRFFVEPDFDMDPNGDFEAQVDDLVTFAIEPLMVTWFNASGFEYQMGVNARAAAAVTEGNTNLGS